MTHEPAISTALSSPTASQPARPQRRSDALLEVQELVVEFPTKDGIVRAVDRVDLRLEYGQRLGVVGESGSGKSVLGRTVMGLTRSTEARITGTVVLAGHQILELSESRRRDLWGREVAMVFQDPLSALHPITPVGEQIVEAVRREPGVGKRAAAARAVELLETVGIPLAAERFHARAYELSGGMRQRVAIAMAVANRPKLLIADEPTTALDATVQARILDLFDELCTEFDIGLIMISHDLGVVGAHTDEVAVMYAGRIAERGPVAAVFSAPSMRYTSALMSAIPDHRNGRRALPKPIPGLPPNLLELAPGCAFAPRCLHASERCRAERPPLLAITTDSTHHFACWHPGSPGAVATVEGAT